LLDGHTTRHRGQGLSQLQRKCLEQCFGWGKTIGQICQVMVWGQSGPVTGNDDGGIQPDAAMVIRLNDGHPRSLVLGQGIALLGNVLGAALRKSH